MMVKAPVNQMALRYYVKFARCIVRCTVYNYKYKEFAIAGNYYFTFYIICVTQFNKLFQNVCNKNA